MKNLIFIVQEQFGYNPSTYYYSKYIKNYYNVYYLCWDHGLPKIHMDNVNVIYIKRNGNILLRTIRFLFIAQKTIKRNDIVLIKYFKIISSVIQIIKRNNCIIHDIRTGSIHLNRTYRFIQDSILRLELYLFHNITVISNGLAKKFKISHKAHVLPLGADIISETNKSFEYIHLIYVGTLLNRNVHDTIYGFIKFYNEYQNKLFLKYTIICNGPDYEEIFLKEIIRQYNMDNIIDVIGVIPHNKLKPYFDKANIGVSYVPMTPYYDCQPVTKNFEYLLSGIPIIATNTYENRNIINDSNGILINDGIDNFYDGLIKIFKQRYNYQSYKIRNDSMSCTWSNVVHCNLLPYLNSITEHA